MSLMKQQEQIAKWKLNFLLLNKGKCMGSKPIYVYVIATIIILSFFIGCGYLVWNFMQDPVPPKAEATDFYPNNLSKYQIHTPSTPQTEHPKPEPPLSNAA